MSEPRVENLAKILVNYSTKVQAEEWVNISASHVALPLVKAVTRYVLEAGGYPFVNLTSGEVDETYLRFANDKQLGWVAPTETHAIKNGDVFIFIEASENTRALSGIDSERQQKRQAAYEEWIQVYMNRSANKELRWVLTNYPCQAFAQDADMSLSEYEDFVYKATFADQDDPVGHWVKIHNEQQALVERVAGKKKVEIRGKYAELSMSIEGRVFINSDGDQNMPSGEIFTSPVEDSVNGWVEFTYPAVHLGREVEGVRLEIENGKVVKASADKNEEFLNKMLDVDDGARIIGELGIGTNYGITQFTKNILYDEKIGGSFHLALGNGYQEAGGMNQSSLHWDMICDAREDTEILMDGDLFYKNGKFKI